MPPRISTRDIPQANSLSLVGDFLALTDAGITDKASLAKQMGIDPRQVDYYKHAARILGLVLVTGRSVSITDDRHVYLKIRRPAEKLGLLRRAVRNAEAIRLLLHAFTDAEINKPNICRFLSKNSGLTGSTVGRRADTIVAWLKRVSEFDPENFHSLSIHAHAQAPSAYLQYRASEEGEEHLRLRESLAHNPGLVEEGLALVREEYQFPTHDRADLLFLDSRSRFLAVEVEVDVGPQDVVGLLQAVKYRAMIMVQFGREPTEVRAMLVARRIDPIMCERAKRYGIETREVSQT